MRDVILFASVMGLHLAATIALLRYVFGGGIARFDTGLPASVGETLGPPTPRSGEWPWSRPDGSGVNVARPDRRAGETCSIRASTPCFTRARGPTNMTRAQRLSGLRTGVSEGRAPQPTSGAGKLNRYGSRS
jgi:hypothetical protein